MTERAHIVVSGQGTAGAVPDQCVVVLSLNALADSPADALDRCGQAATGVLAALDHAGVDRRDVQTTNLSVQDFFDQERREVTARIASYQMTVLVRDLDRLGQVVGTLTSAAGDALQIRSLHLRVSDQNALERLARIDAVADARAKATDLAQAAGVRLGPILSIVDGAPAQGPGPRRAMAMSARASPPVPVPIEPGEAVATAVVTITFELAD